VKIAPPILVLRRLKCLPVGWVPSGVGIPESVRRALNLKPGTKVRYWVEGTRLIVEPIPTVDELAEREPTVTIKLKDFLGDRRRLSADLEK